MPAGHGVRARTRDLFARPFRKKGYAPLSTYLRTYKIGQYVDIKVNGSIHKGMPHKFYHGGTGVVWNVTKRAIGVEMNKEVTFRDPDSSRRACADPAPTIDGRRANCNLASLGSRRSQPCTPRPGNQVPVMTSFPLQTRGPRYPGRLTFPQHFGQCAFQEGFPYHIYGFSPYSTDYAYPPSYYNPYGGTQFPHIYPSQGMVSSPVLYPCYPFNQPLQTANGVSYPQAQTLSVPAHVLQFPTPAPGNGISRLPQQTYGGIMSTPAAVPATTVSVLPNHIVQQYAVQPAIYHSKEVIHQLKVLPLNSQQNEES